MPTHKLSFTPSELSETAKAHLERRLLVDDYESMWMSVPAVLELLVEGDWIKGLTVDAEDVNWDKPKPSDIPKVWWKEMAFSPKMEKAIKAFWKKYPDGEIEWEW